MSTLLEILARDWTDWPEGYEFAIQDADEAITFSHSDKIAFDGEDWWGRDGDLVRWSDTTYHDELATDHATAIVTREMWEAERRKQTGSIFVNCYYGEKPQWRGPEDGLPPVGTPLLIRSGEGASLCVGVINYIDVAHCVWHWDDGSDMTMYARVSGMEFRPIDTRTPREKWIEAALKVTDLEREDAERALCEIYDAGLAKLPEDGE